MRIKLMTQIKTIIKTIEIVMTMEIIAVRTKMFLQRIVQVLKISLMKIKHRHIQKIAPLNNLTMEKQQLRLIQMNQIIVQTN